jgi:ankyrin repeat protein
MQNECGDTALHQAIRAPKNKVACVDLLMDMDPELVCFLREEGASPLYLAMSLGEMKIARHLSSTSGAKASCPTLDQTDATSCMQRFLVAQVLNKAVS